LECIVNDKVDFSQRNISLSKRLILTIDYIEHNYISPLSRINIDLKASQNDERKLIFVFQRIHSLTLPLLSYIFE
jgi:hypothetical protein